MTPEYHEDDYTDPTFVLGAVLAQVEDLTLERAQEVLTDALGQIAQRRFADELPATEERIRVIIKRERTLAGASAEPIPIDACICESQVTRPRGNCWAETHNLKT